MEKLKLDQNDFFESKFFHNKTCENIKILMRYAQDSLKLKLLENPLQVQASPAPSK